MYTLEFRDVVESIEVYKSKGCSYWVSCCPIQRALVRQLNTTKVSCGVGTLQIDDNTYNFDDAASQFIVAFDEIRESLLKLPEITPADLPIKLPLEFQITPVDIASEIL